MRLPILPTVLTALLVAALLLGGAWLVLHPGGPALTAAAFSLKAITPNADGRQDVTRLSYTLRRPANVSIYFLDAQGRRFDFRRDAPRASGDHQVDFSGIVDAYHLPGDTFTGELLARVLPNGAYTWVVEAAEAGRPSGQITGPLTISDADTTLPELRNFTVSPPEFTPNQDGLNDRVRINVWLDKDVAEDGLQVTLISNADNTQLPIAETNGALQPGQRGEHQYDYDGGIDLGQNPPPDGLYVVRAEAEDRLGQRLAVTSTLTIKDGGLPRAEILNGLVEFSATTVQLGQTLYFTLTVENYGRSPIRTSGPPAGTVYQSMTQNANTLGEYEQSGVYRIGLMCQTCKSDYPWRWALGTPDTLTTVKDESGHTQYYLMPGQRAVVTGGVVLDQVVESRNPQYFWAGLIHEDVEMVNDRVDAHYITIAPNK